MFKREELHGKFIGYSLEKHGKLFFFGSRFLPRTQLSAVFPSYEFCFLKQVHGRAVVQADPAQTLEADAHFTDERNRALVSQSADCVPILLFSDNRICAIHSGWRGAAQNIVHASAEAFRGQRVLCAAIGPHIMKSSFEVGREVAAQLSGASPLGPQGLILPHPKADKAFFDLTELVRRQLRHAFGADLEIVECLEDTETSAQFHSFRRDRERAERQFSFVVNRG